MADALITPELYDLIYVKKYTNTIEIVVFPNKNDTNKPRMTV
jgi:hypothetical protein